MEETGEVAREVNHLHGVKKRKAGEPEGNLSQELADIIMTVVCMANSHNIDLQKEWDIVMEKLHSRDQNRFDKK